MVPALEMGALQKVQNAQRGSETGTEWHCNTCQIWSYWYAEVRLTYPDVPRYELLCTLQSILAVEQGIAIRIFEGMRNFVLAVTPDPSTKPEWNELKKRVHDQLQFVRNVPFSHFLNYPSRQREEQIQVDVAEMKSAPEAAVESRMLTFIRDYESEPNIGWDLLHVFKFWSNKLSEILGRGRADTSVKTLIKLQALLYKHEALWVEDKQLSAMVKTEIRQNDVSLGKWFGGPYANYSSKLNELQAFLENGARMSGVYTILKMLSPAPADHEPDLFEIIHRNYRSWVRDDKHAGSALEDLLTDMELKRLLFGSGPLIRASDIRVYVDWCTGISSKDSVAQLVLRERLLNVVYAAQNGKISLAELLGSGIFYSIFSAMFKNFNLQRFNQTVYILNHMVTTQMSHKDDTGVEPLRSILQLFRKNAAIYQSKSKNAHVEQLKIAVNRIRSL
jgi:hypothetical protein